MQNISYIVNSVLKVAVFDSGIGGINVLRGCVAALPWVDFVYFADNSHVPYGGLGADELHSRVNEIFDRIAALSPAAAVVACNTVTGSCIGDLRARYPFPLIGVEPAIKPAATVGGKCLVLATPTTVRSPNVLSLVSRYGEGRVELAACPDLADYIERNIFNLKEEEVRALLPRHSARSVVLGCTHYIYVKREIEKFYGCKSFDGIDGVVGVLKNKLQKYVENGCERCGKVEFSGGDADKNERVFKSGNFSQEIPNFS